MNFLENIRIYGNIETIQSENEKPVRQVEAKADIYMAKITNLFLPYISENISETKFCILQEKLKHVISECMKEKTI